MEFSNINQATLSLSRQFQSGASELAENILKATFRKLRPGSGGKQKGISIVDSVGGRAPDVVRRPRIKTEEDYDPDETHYPVALANQTPGPTIPRGLLSNADPESGAIPFYEADDPKVLKRLFNIDVDG